MSAAHRRARIHARDHRSSACHHFDSTRVFSRARSACASYCGDVSPGPAIDHRRAMRSAVCTASLACAIAIASASASFAHEPLRLRALLVTDVRAGDAAPPDLGLRGEARLTLHDDAARLDLVGWSLPPQVRDVTLALEGDAGAREAVVSLPLERDGSEGRVIGAHIPIDTSVQQRLARGEGRLLLRGDGSGVIGGPLRAHGRRTALEPAEPPRPDR
jgi:hypothetical protein